MTERPINLTGDEVRAILDGTKTQLRRVMKGWSLEFLAEFTPAFVAHPENHPPYVIGDQLWARESFSDASGTGNPHSFAFYRATYHGHSGVAWRPSIHMPRWASRITLEITGVRVERLHEITAQDAKAEGIEITDELTGAAEDLNGIYVKAFWMFWDSINGKRAPWSSNPFVWVVEFRRVAQ